MGKFPALCSRFWTSDLRFDTKSIHLSCSLLSLFKLLKIFSGHYLYAEVPFNGKETDTAILLLPSSNPTNHTTCLSFAVMFVGLSNIVLEILGTRNNVSETIWRTTSGILNWHVAHVQIDPETTDIRIIAKQGKHSHSAVAIDDVELENGTCKSM